MTPPILVMIVKAILEDVKGQRVCSAFLVEYPSRPVLVVKVSFYKMAE